MDEQNMNAGAQPETGDDILLPEGWNEGDTLDSLLEESQDTGAADSGEDSLDSLLAETQADPDPLGELLAETEEKPEAEPEPEDGAEQQKRPPRMLTLQVNHGKETLDVNSLSDDELTALLQKGRAFDQLKESQNQQLYRETYQQQLDAGMTEAAARLVAKDAVGGKSYELTDEQESVSQERNQSAQERTQASPTPMTQGRNLRGEVEQLRAIYPDITTIPQEVSQAVRKGANLLTAYLAYQQRAAGQGDQALRRENQTLRQNARNAAAAPVKGVTGGGTKQTRGKNIFEQGFDAGLEWK